MLVVSRKRGEEFFAKASNGELIRMVVVDIRRDKVRLGFEAEDKVELHRREIAAKLGWTAKDPKQFNGEATPAAAGKEEGPAKLPA